MQERVVTIDRDTHPLSPNFTVFATQNPIESEGTYPLPEAQRDRFLFKIVMPYPARDDEFSLARKTLSAARRARGGAGARRGAPVVTAEALAALRANLAGSPCARNWSATSWTSCAAPARRKACSSARGPRATQALLLASRAAAALDGRDFVTPDDVRALASPVLEHRLVLRPEFEIEGLTLAEVVGQIMQKVAVPR